MTQVGQGEIKAMGDIMAKLNRALGETTSKPLPAGSVATPTDDREANVAAMSDIMARFREATSNIREDAQHDDVLMEALQTEETETGVRIAQWEITVSKHTGRPGKFYDITNSALDTKIASDLRLYEAALLLTQELNRGESITSPKIMEILRLEEEFSKNLDDAAHYGNIVKKTSGNKKVIAEARFSDARSKAIAARQKIQEVR